MHYIRTWFIGFAAACMMLVGCGHPEFDEGVMREHAEQLKELTSFQFPLDDYFPETPVTDTDPPKTEREELFHSAEDSFAPAGTPVYAIGDGIIRYSGKMGGYGWLIIIDHPVENVYSLYGHLSTSRWKKRSGKVKKGELIAYLATAEAGETTVPHLHFGLRIGKRADYLRKREYNVNGRRLHASDFKITSERYNEKQDLDQMIRQEFGDLYRLADWKDILTFSENIEEWADSVGLTVGGGKDALMISNDGYGIWHRRQYSISRFNHKKPEHFLAHGSIDNNYVCLGSWHGLNRRILAVKK